MTNVRKQEGLIWLATGLFLVVAVFSATGCKLIDSLLKPDYGSLEITVNVSSQVAAQTIAPPVVMDVSSYNISGTSPGGSSFSVEGVQSDTYTQNSMASGSWTIHVDAVNADGILIAADEDQTTISAGQTTQLSMTVVPLTGNGDLSIDISWPDGSISNPAIVAAMTPYTGAANDITFDIQTGGATYSGSWPAGYYGLSISLYSGPSIVWGKVEAVRIVEGQTSSGSYQYSPPGSLLVTIDEDLQNPITITLSGDLPELDHGSNMTVEATCSETPDAYQWYLNGDPIPGATNSSITIGASLSPGNYSLDLLVAKDVRLSSEGVYFIVKPGDFGYFDNVESGSPGVTATGFWHVVDTSSPYSEYTSATHSWWYGQEATGTYANGSANSGSLVTPPITISGSATLDFWSWYETETSGTMYDQRWVKISTDGGQSYQNLYQLSNEQMDTWVEWTIDLSSYSGQTVRLQFYFDTMDATGNGYRGWYLDDIGVSGSPGTAQHVKIFQDVAPWSSTMTGDLLSAMGLTQGSGTDQYEFLASIDMPSATLTPGVDLVVISSVQSQSFYDTYAANQSRFDAFVANGGTILWSACTYTGVVLGPGATLPGGVTMVQSDDSVNYVQTVDHPITEVFSSGQEIDGSYASHGYFASLVSGTTQLVVNSAGYPTLVEYTNGGGKVLASTMTFEYGQTDITTLFDRTLHYVLGKVMPQMGGLAPGFQPKLPIGGTSER